MTINDYDLFAYTDPIFKKDELLKHDLIYMLPNSISTLFSRIVEIHQNSTWNYNAYFIHKHEQTYGN